MYTLHVHTASTHCMYTLQVHTACTHCMYTLHVHTACTHYMYTLHVHTACTHCMYTLHVHTAGPILLSINNQDVKGHDEMEPEGIGGLTTEEAEQVRTTLLS